MTTERPEIRVGVSMVSEPEPRALKAAASEDPFDILLVGDFSGAACRGVSDAGGLGRRPLRRIDRDDFDEVLAAMSPTLHLPLAASRVATEVTFAELDDFEPDALYRRVELFTQLRQLRERLLSPATAAAAIAEMTGAGSEGPRDVPPGEGEAPPEAGGSLLENALQETEARPETEATGSELVDRLVREYVLPYAIPRQDPRVDELVADVDRAISEQMRALLHAPAFRELEANWRSLYLLVRRLETGRKLRIWLCDVSRDELRADLVAAEDPLRSGFAKILLDRAGETQGGVSYGIVVGDLIVEPATEDVELAGRLAVVCARAGSPFVCGAAPAWVGCESFAVSSDPDDWQRDVDDEALAAWQQLRQRPEAAALGVVMPRYLVRRPYGARSSPVRCFEFEEERDGADHEQLPWGSAAVLVALLVAKSWQRGGWAMRGLVDDEVGGVPAHVRYEAGQPEAVPCAEVELTSRGAERMAERGFMALFSVRGADAVRLGALRSVAVDGSGLAGRWGAR